MNRSISDWGGNILAFFSVILINGMANGIPIGGQTTGEISAKYPSLFTPAGYVFSIWGLIYLGLTTFLIWQALPAQRSNERLADIRIPFLASCACNAIWIFMWHYDLLFMSLVLMLGILASLIQIYRKLNIALSDTSATERWFVHLPFSIYIGWITVATIANISAAQIHWGWDSYGFNAETWTLIKIALAGAIAVTILFRRRDIAFVLVVVWAAVGITVKHLLTPMVAGGAAVLAIAATLLIVAEFITRPRSARS
jgi:benzodiazapine receptor